MYEGALSGTGYNVNADEGRVAHIHCYKVPECLNESVTSVLVESETSVVHLLVCALLFLCRVVLGRE